LLVLLGVVAIVLALTFEDFLTPYDNSASVGDASPDGTIDISVATNTSLGTSAVSTGDGSRDPTSETLKAITSPKIFGALLLLLITAAAAKLIVDKLGTSGEIE